MPKVLLSVNKKLSSKQKVYFLRFNRVETGTFLISVTSFEIFMSHAIIKKEREARKLIEFQGELIAQ